MTTITGTPVTIPLVKASGDNLGVCVEASIDGGKTWQCVQYNRYTVREASPSVMAYRTCIDPARDVADYFAELDRRGIRYKRVRE